MPFCWTSPASAYRRGGTIFYWEAQYWPAMIPGPMATKQEKAGASTKTQYVYIAVADIDGLYRKLRKNNATSLQSGAVELMPWSERLFFLHAGPIRHAALLCR